MKKKIALLIAAVFLLSGCSSTQTPAETQEKAAETQTSSVTVETTTEELSENTEESPIEDTSQETEQNALVIYFSRTGEQYTVGVIEKGNTAIVAEMIAEQTGADLFEVLPEDDHYPMTYDALTDVAKQEQADKARPAYAGELPDLSAYDTIFIGAPVWWGDWPMIMYTVFENNDFSGKTLIPFSTHEGSGLSGFDKKLENTCPDTTVEKGLAIRGNDAQNAQKKARDSVSDWLSELGF
ncbi:MAG: flavodoxin [Oscillospiraceae bacterium]|nr:flavodoxin [Oscillospiraceae bacterium]